jgi:hypothetical protein
MAERNTLDSLQVLRAIAALLVVSLHTDTMVQYKHVAGPLSTWIAPWGAAGVDIFFVISGVVMVVTTARAPPGLASARTFLTSRLRRIVPLYWALTTLWLALLLFAPALLDKQRLALEPGIALASYLFIPTFNPAWQNDVPLLYVGWTLDYEMFFYVLFAAALFFTRRHIVPVLASIFVLLVVTGMASSPASSAARAYTSPQLLEFVMGCSIGALYVRGAALSLRSCFAIGAAALLLAIALYPLLQPDGWSHGFDRLAAYGIPAFLLVACCLFLERGGHWPRLGILRKIGDSSYSLYLTHMFVLPVLGRVLGKLPLPQSDLWFFAALAACVTVAHFVHRLGEKPADAWLRGRAAAQYS